MVLKQRLMFLDELLVFLTKLWQCHMIEIKLLELTVQMPHLARHSKSLIQTRRVRKIISIYTRTEKVMASSPMPLSVSCVAMVKRQVSRADFPQLDADLAHIGASRKHDPAVASP